MSDQVSEPTEPVSKYPRSQKLRDELLAEEERLEAILEPARKRLDEIMADPLKKEEVELRKVIKEAQAALFPIKNELAALTKAGGVKHSLKAEPGEYK